MYTKLDTGTRTREADKSKTIRQDNCQCTCNSATEVPGGHDGVIIARDFAGNQVLVDTSIGGSAEY